MCNKIGVEPQGLRQYYSEITASIASTFSSRTRHDSLTTSVSRTISLVSRVCAVAPELVIREQEQRRRQDHCHHRTASTRKRELFMQREQSVEQTAKAPPHQRWHTMCMMCQVIYDGIQGVTASTVPHSNLMQSPPNLLKALLLLTCSRTHAMYCLARSCHPCSAHNKTKAILHCYQSFIAVRPPEL
jgi:hypothetical protein